MGDDRFGRCVCFLCFCRRMNRKRDRKGLGGVRV